jgi:hypothetical protein
MSSLTDQISSYLGSKINSIKRAFDPTVVNSPANQFWQSPTANALGQAQSAYQKIPQFITGKYNLQAPLENLAQQNNLYNQDSLSRNAINATLYPLRAAAGVLQGTRDVAANSINIGQDLAQSPYIWSGGKKQLLQDVGKTAMSGLNALGSEWSLTPGGMATNAFINSVGGIANKNNQYQGNTLVDKIGRGIGMGYQPAEALNIDRQKHPLIAGAVDLASYMLIQHGVSSVQKANEFSKALDAASKGDYSLIDNVVKKYPKEFKDVNTFKNNLGKIGATPTATDVPSVSLEPVKTTPGVFIEKPTPQGLDALAQEARKYGSAEEFVNSKATYYTGGKQEVKEFLPSMKNKLGEDKPGVFLTSSKDYAKTFSGKEGQITQVFPDIKKPYLVSPENELLVEAPQSYSGFISDLKAKGYDSLVLKGQQRGFGKGTHDQVLVLDPSILKTKAQLTDFYNQSKVGVTGGVKPKGLQGSEIGTVGKTPQIESQAQGQPLVSSLKSPLNDIIPQEGKLITEPAASRLLKEGAVGTKAYKGGLLSKDFPSKVLSSDVVKDRGPFSYQRESLLRNIEDTFGREANTGKQVKQYFYDPIVANETKSVQFRDALKKDITTTFKDLGITKRGSKEDMAAADLIEGKITLEQLKSEFPSKWQNIVSASEKGRAVYKDLLGRINKAIEPYGYSPIPERSNYVTHTQQISELTNKFGSLLNFSKEKLPTEMSGINMDVKPGKQFFKFGLKRQGGSTHEGLITALDKYIEPASKQIFHTEDIQRGRAMLDYLSKSAGPQDSKLSNFNSYLSMYTDSLAGKKNVIDRPFEKVFGRKILNVGSWAKGRTGANMVGGNVSSALTNYIPFTQSISTTSKPAVVKGLWEGLKIPFGDLNTIDGVQSGYLTRNFPKNDLFPTLGQKTIKTSGILFNLVDKFTKKSVIAAKYFEKIAKGLKPQEAMNAADEYGSRVLVDRSYGQTPLIFGSKTLGAFTQFQTEVNNQMSFVFKDIPKNFGYNKVQIASALAQFTVLSYVFNNIYEKITGRRPQIDPIHLVQSFVSGLQQGESVMSMLNPTDSNTPVGEFVSNLPFNPAGGRLPIGAAIPNPFAIAAGTSTFEKEIKKPLYYLLPPTAGGQIKKTIEGIGAYSKQASVTDKGQVRFPIAQTPQNAIRTALFGQYSTPEARTYFNENQRPLSDKQSQFYTISTDKNSVYKTIVQARKDTAAETKVKDQVKKSGEPSTTSDKFFYLDGDTVKTIDLNPQITPPKLTGDALYDKKLTSTYNSGITSAQADIIKLVDLNQITQEEGIAQLNKLEALRIVAPKKPKALKKVPIPAFKKLTSKKLTLAKMKVQAPKTVKQPTYKVPQVNLEALRNPTVARLPQYKQMPIPKGL